MGWLRRAADIDPGHVCTPPMREVWIRPPPPLDADPPRRHRMDDEPDGDIGDVWTCDTCRTAWRIGWTCVAHDHFRYYYATTEDPIAHRGVHTVGLRWRRATRKDVRRAARGHAA